METSTGRARIYSVSELTAGIKRILEQQFPFVWLTGEISNFRMPVSGHFYFTLKDEAAQIQAVMFRAQNRSLRFAPEDGLAVTGLGRISVYEPRGTYQVILEYLEPKGAGALQVAFEQLKRRLEQEGLFDTVHKKELPALPKRIGLVTSPTGAVVHDMLQILSRRFPGLTVDIVPVKVQGDAAAGEITTAIELLNRLQEVSVIVLARGGGSLEDLQAFNSESVARAIYASTIPVVSAVGHETDYTIADFTADLRAPTPSAAAEMIVPVKLDLFSKIKEYETVLLHSIKQILNQWRVQVNSLGARLVEPRKALQDHRLRLDDWNSRLHRAVKRQADLSRERLNWKTKKLFYNNPNNYINKHQQKLQYYYNCLMHALETRTAAARAALRETAARLEALSPLEILSRGYSITRTIPDERIVRDAASVAVGQELRIILAGGRLTCGVKERFSDDEKIL